MKILIVVDPQNDFVKADGKLAVPNADNPDIINNINKLLESEKFDFKICTQDWHPQGHISFASTHDSELFVERDTMQGAGSSVGNKVIKQVMWPDHCIAGTDGANIYDYIKSWHFNAIFRKGTDKFRECYSVFEYVYEKGITVMGDEYLTPHFHMVKALNVDEIYVCGFATDFCVMQTAISATRLAKKVYTIMDACAAVDANNLDGVYKKFDDVRIGMLNTSWVLEH